MIKSDSPTANDQLDRKPFAQQIATTLFESFKNGNDSLVIGLTGSWGSGKSTMLDFIKGELKGKIEQSNPDKYVIYNFNPWTFSNQANLQASFLLELMNLFHDTNDEIKGFLSKILDVSRKSKFLVDRIPMGKEFREIAEGFLENATQEPSLDDLKKKINTALERAGIRLYIFIDDLDRLTTDEILEVFQLVKQNANFKNTFFVLAFDKKIIIEALKKRYETYGESYLEKIVQVDFPIPNILEDDIQKIFFKELDDFLQEKNIPFDIEKLRKVWLYHGLKMYFQTLRQVYRYINALHFRLPHIHTKVNVLDFLLLESIRVFDYDAYIQIYQESIRHGHHKMYSGYKSDQKKISFINLQATDPIASFLSNKDIRKDYELSTERLLSDMQYFERYFSLKNSTIDIYESELTDFINHIGGRSHILRHAYRTNRLEELFYKISNISSRVAIDKTLQIFYSLIKFMNDNEHIINTCYASFLNMTASLCLSSSKLPRGQDYLYTRIIEFNNSLSRIQVYLLHVILTEVKGDKPLSFLNVNSVVFFKEREIKLREVLQKKLRDWYDHILHEPTKENILFFPTLKWSYEFFPEELNTYYDRLFDKPNKLASVVMFFSSKKNEEDVPDFFSAPSVMSEVYYRKFLERINDLDLARVNISKRNFILLVKAKIDDLRNSIGDLYAGS